MKEVIEKKLSTELSPEFLEVKNNSHLHLGHLGDNGSGETHFAITVKSKKLQDISRVEAHRIVKRILSAEFEKGLHALEIKIIK